MRAMRWRIGVTEQRHRRRIMEAGHAESFGNRIGGDVIMRWADAACGENIVVPRAKRIDRLHDLIFLIRNDADFLQINADRCQDIGQMTDVAVLGAARQDFVADDEHGGCDDVRHDADSVCMLFACSCGMKRRHRLSPFSAPNGQCDARNEPAAWQSSPDAFGGGDQGQSELAS
jgi:hypothetical protein